MQSRIRQCLAMLGLLLGAACADSPTPPTTTPENTHPSAIVYYPPEDGDVCDPWLDINWCKGRRMGECITSSPSTGDLEASVQSCDGSGGSGGGGTQPPSPPPPSEPIDTCKTGDVVIDDPSVSAGLQNLWAQSNPDANLAQRRETAGWIVQTAAGYSIASITTSSANFGCAEFTVQFPTYGTVVGFVHTHPYQVDETVSDCDLRSVQDYTGAPSDEDRVASKLLGNALGRTEPLPGYIIDKAGYYRFEGSRYTATPRLPRCGY